VKWESWGTADGGPRRDGGTQCHPHPRWRCRVWHEPHYGDHPMPMEVWCWEVRRFGRHPLHLSGAGGNRRLCRIASLAVAEALGGRLR
jgi:hypothetical protein